MKTDKILAQPSRVLSQDQRSFFFDQGYQIAPGLIEEVWLARLNEAIGRLIERSRALSASDGVFDLEEGHCAEAPRLRRIAFLDDLDPLFWEFARDSVMADLAADVVGPDVVFREIMINFKWAGGGQAVKWHQDIPFYPHTNLSPTQFLVFLGDVTAEQGALTVVPESHKGPIFEHYDENDHWIGAIPDHKLGEISLDRAVELTGSAGTVTLHHSATVHGSAPNLSDQGRPVLILGYNAADARPYTAPAYPSSHDGTLVRGQPAKYAHHEAVTLRLPPDWSTGYSSIFEYQAPGS
ncbi:MAG: phytanoyl-CoA dioxygenase family protein [Pseudomonadota bacterium]